MGRDSSIYLDVEKVERDEISTFFNDFELPLELNRFFQDVEEVDSSPNSNGHPRMHRVWICYWRNVESIPEFLLRLSKSSGVIEDDFEFVLNKEIVSKLIDYLVNTLKSPCLFQSRTKTIDEYYPVIAENIMVLSWLLEFMNSANYRNSEVVFTDSY